METLKMIAYQYSGKLFRSKHKSEKEIPEDEMCHNNWWYLHGKLEKLVGYDKAITTNCKSAGYSKETIDWSLIKDNKVTMVFKDRTRPVMYINAIIPVKIEGINKPCIGYFWTTDEHPIYWKEKSYPYWNQRGLVCFKDDKEACEFALGKYLSKTTMI